MKIKAIVKFNSGIAIVLDSVGEMLANRYGNTIIDTNGLLYGSLVLGHDPYAKAFAGRKFSVQLENGEVIECSGQWWDGISNETRKVIGEDIIRVTASDIQRLKSCYVFNGYYASKAAFETFIKSYTGRIYGYWEYDGILNRKKAYRSDRIDFRERKNHRRFKTKFYAGELQITTTE
jgi:hypothetical protein